MNGFWVAVRDLASGIPPSRKCFLCFRNPSLVLGTLEFGLLRGQDGYVLFVTLQQAPIHGPADANVRLLAVLLTGRERPDFQIGERLIRRVKPRIYWPVSASLPLLWGGPNITGPEP
jgi:hypothetical protein